MPPQTFPEGVGTVRIRIAAHLGDDAIAEPFRVFGQEQKTATGEQAAVAPLTPGRTQIEGAEFGAAGVVVTQIERPEFIANAQFPGVVNLNADMVMVTGQIQPHGSGEAATAGHLAAAAVLQHK